MSPGLRIVPDDGQSGSHQLARRVSTEKRACSNRRVDSRSTGKHDLREPALEWQCETPITPFFPKHSCQE
jgi:hypothetical protein